MTEHDTPDLPVPDDVRDADDARELLRAWVADGKLALIFDGEVWDDPAAWGIFLADFMRHVRDALHDKHGGDREAIMNRIGEGLRAELAVIDAPANDPGDAPR